MHAALKAPANGFRGHLSPSTQRVGAGKWQGIDLFAGSGGLSAGAGASGIDIAYAVESDRFAALTYAHNHKNTKLFNHDIRKAQGCDFAGLDRDAQVIVFGGPPCQGFSTSNQKDRSLANEKNWLYRECLHLVNEIKPDWVVFENVKGLVETSGGFFLDAILSGFKASGYSTSHFILNAADYGVPQNRNRLFIIASLHGNEFLCRSIAKRHGNLPQQPSDRQRQARRRAVRPYSARRELGRHT